MALKYEGLQEKYENLSKLYMDLLKQRGGAVEEGQASVEVGGVGESILPHWRPEGEGIREEITNEMLGQEFDVNELLFGTGMTVGPGEA